jgi:hypothetical protein
MVILMADSSTYTGKFVWYDLMTTNPAVSLKYYSSSSDGLRRKRRRAPKETTRSGGRPEKDFGE